MVWRFVISAVNEFCVVPGGASELDKDAEFRHSVAMARIVQSYC